MKGRFFLLAGLMLVFLSACAQMSPVGSVQNNEIRTTHRLAIDHSNHESLAKYHENIAKEMQGKLQKQKKLLQEYEDHSQYYGRRGLDLKSHAKANIRYYEQSLKDNLKEAAIHSKMAKEQKELNYTDAEKNAIPIQLKEEATKPLKAKASEKSEESL
ncbi:hypothetical protein [Nitrosomonas communis]|uniref:Lipoprotein n=1 Tax=Nitrosomonas communis TaxID=44574 RepID=A0A1I4RA17_9PROT|nr:hypothetical protein [Nitrosomonas communis]SFM49091.1 hypothetical protein SAMN05421863_103133 [Nitrosomonas communis]